MLQEFERMIRRDDARLEREAELFVRAGYSLGELTVVCGAGSDGGFVRHVVPKSAVQSSK